VRYTGNLTGPRSREQACAHTCSQCGKTGQELAFSMVRNAQITITRDGKTERYEVHGMGGEYPYSIDADLAPGNEQIPLPPPPPEVWLVYKHGGAYGNGGDPLQGIYSTEKGAKDSVRFAVKQERASLAARLGQPETPHSEPEPELRWMRGHHWRYGPIPGEYHAEAGLANFVVKRYKVPEGYLPDTTWCVVPHTSEGEAAS
jgi:hypothetical protein